MPNWQAIEEDLKRDIARVDRAKRKASRKGKRSRAHVNLKRIGLKHGVPYYGYSELDYLAAKLIMESIRW